MDQMVTPLHAAAGAATAAPPSLLLVHGCGAVLLLLLLLLLLSSLLFAAFSPRLPLLQQASWNPGSSPAAPAPQDAAMGRQEGKQHDTQHTRAADACECWLADPGALLMPYVRLPLAVCRLTVQQGQLRHDVEVQPFRRLFARQGNRRGEGVR